MLCTVEVPNLAKLVDLALVRWFDFKYKNPKKKYMYSCPLFEFTDIYDFVPVESILKLVHIVPRFEENNEYFLNAFLF